MRTFIAILVLTACAGAEARTWTSASGKTVEADLVSLQGSMVVLQTADGQKLSIGLQVLSREDQEFVKAQQNPDQAKKPEPPSALPDDLRGPEARAADVKPGAAPTSAPPAEVAGDAKPAVAPPTVAPPAAPVPAGPAKPALPTLSRPGAKKSAEGDVLTDEQIAALKREAVVDEKAGEKVEFNGGMTPKRHLDKNEKEWGADQPIPFKITCELVRVRPAKKGGEDRKNLSGNVRFYVLDSSGAVILSKSMPIDRMLPKGDSGYKDELPKQGKYTLVMYAEHKGTTFGLKEALSVGIPKAH